MVFVLLLVAGRVWLLFTLNNIIDSDQPILWAGLKDFSEGKFYEPRFYGQSYNTLMESLFAVPLYRLGVLPHTAVAAATHFIFLVPLLFTAFFLFSKDKKESAIVVLATILCMTPAYDIMTSLPRGFVTGLFFTTFYILSFYDPTNLRWLMLNLVLSVFGVFVNPNIIIVFIPLFIYTLYYNYRLKEFYGLSAISLLLAFPLYLFFNRFYDLHPDYITYAFANIFSVRYLIENLTHLDQTFAHIGFFFENNCLLLLVTFIFVCFYLYGKKRGAFLGFCSMLFVILLSFFAGKTRDGSLWPFYSFSRMYLGIPLVLGLVGSFFSFRSKYIVGVLVTVTLSFTIFKALKFEEHLAYHTDIKRGVGVSLQPITIVDDAMRVYGGHCKKQGAKYFFISNIFWLSTFMNYGGSAYYPDFPETQDIKYERRYWLRDYKKDSITTKFMLLTINSDFDKMVEGKYPFETKRIDDYGLFLISNNKLTNKKFLSIVCDIEK